MIRSMKHGLSDTTRKTDQCIIRLRCWEMARDPCIVLSISAPQLKNTTGIVFLKPTAEPPPAPAPANDIFPEPPDEVAVAAAILKKNRCRSRKRIENTIKSMNPKMSMADARALLQQMEARGFVLIDAQGHATFT